MSVSVQKKKFVIFPFLIVLALIIIAGILFTVFSSDKVQYTMSLSENSYDSLFISMYSIENYSAEDFQTFRGLNTLINPHPVKSSKELISYLDSAFASGNVIDTVYIGLDPYKIYQSGATSEAAMAETLTGLFAYMRDYPDVTFEILLPAPQIDYWLALNETQREAALLSYRYLISCMSPHSNAICFFHGSEEWLIANPNNYTGPFSPNPLISQKLLLFSFCDREYQVTVANADLLLDKLRSVIEKQAGAKYPDLSGKTIVFFGDSILGLDYGSYSIPGIINGLTGADVYNYAIGGTTGCDFNTDTDSDNSFRDQVDKFVNRADFYTGDNTRFPYDNINSENMVFVINYGFNDFLFSFEPEDFYQALQNEITLIQNEYPEAQIMIMVPHENVYAGSGKVAPNEQGIFLTEYADAVKKLAAEQNLTLLDVPALVTVDEDTHKEYFRDGCHYNEQGRFYMAEYIIDIIEK